MIAAALAVSTVGVGFAGTPAVDPSRGRVYI